ncbi:hypothetical protein GGI20_005289, partial [Coemansia sp. BCRC 34301]
VLPLARFLAQTGATVVLAANSRPALNDVTEAELGLIVNDAAGVDPALADALAAGRLLVCASGSVGPCIDLRRLDPRLVALAGDVDLIVLVGMARAIVSNFYARFSCDSLRVAVFKNKMAAAAAGASVFDSLIPARLSSSSSSSSSRRRSVDDLKQTITTADGDDDDSTTSSTDSSSKPAANPELWLNDEIEAVGELKRGAIAARFPEEFSVDSDFLNGASNVWLPARLHPEIAPGEFQDWLKKHGSQLSKIEDSVHRRKSILSYSYKTDDQPPPPPPSSVPRGGMFEGAAVRRRNTTGLVRRKSFVERADEEFVDDAPFLVQTTQRSSLKRSKLANKRRDSTASTSATPGGGAGSEKRMSTAEILKQVTAAVDDFGFDDFDLGDLPTYDANAAAGSRNGKKLKRPPPPQQQQPALVSKAPTMPLPKMPPPPPPQAGEQEPVDQRKTVSHKKSGGSWWQWGKDDAAANDERVVMRSPQYERQQQQIYGQQYQSQTAASSTSPSQAAGPHSDEDDDVPLALYRGERNGMTIG